MSSRIRNVRLLAVIAFAACGANGCSSVPSDRSSVQSQNTGSAGMQLKLSRTANINALQYALTGPSGFSATGAIDVDRLGAIEGSIPNVPAGGPYALTLTASSTDHNVACSGSKSGLSVTCPASPPDEENGLTLICTRNHVGREWGDDESKENVRTFFLDVEVNLVCASPDAGTDSGSGSGSDAGGDFQALQCPTSCPAGNNCGTFSSPLPGCPPLDCGSCAPGQVCSLFGSTQGACLPLHDTFPQCDPSTTGPVVSTTLACLANRDKAGSSPATKCSTCVANNGCLDSALQGGTCEGTPGSQTHFSGLFPDGTTCGTIFPGSGSGILTEEAICFQTLSTLLQTNCAGHLQETPCLCGATGSASCLSGTATPTGPAFDEYACDFNSTDPATIQSDFTAASFGAGRANALVECAAAFGCDCFQGCGPAPSCSAAHFSCGSLSDGCGGTVNCGTCPVGQACTAQGQCGPCNPTTCAAQFRTCGSLPDGCGRMLNCGTCPTGQVCLPQGPCCTPTTCAAQNVACGSIPDGCGGTLDCGTCPAGQMCDGDGTPGRCAPVGATLTLLEGLDKATSTPPYKCSTCAISNGCLDPNLQGVTCESAPGTAPDACASVLGTSPPVSEAQVCLSTLNTIFSSTCATQDLTPCLCGTTDRASCFGGTSPATGPALPDYTCDFGTSNVPALAFEFTRPQFGAGRANLVVQCLAAYGCECF